MWEQPEIPTVLQVRDQVSEGVYRGQKGRAFQGPGSLLLGGVLCRSRKPQIGGRTAANFRSPRHSNHKERPAQVWCISLWFGAHTVQVTKTLLLTDSVSFCPVPCWGHCCAYMPHRDWTIHPVFSLGPAASRAEATSPVFGSLFF